MRFVDATASGELLARFHAGIYWDAFEAQFEPLEVWRAALRGVYPYSLTVRLALDGDDIAGGIAYEKYPRSGCGLVVVLGEVNDPRVHGEGEERLARFERWGARVLDVRYVQPKLGPGLARDRGLVLIAFPPVPAEIDGATVRAFVDELYAVTEGGPPDPEIAIPEIVRSR